MFSRRRHAQFDAARCYATSTAQHRWRICRQKRCAADEKVTFAHAPHAETLWRQAEEVIRRLRRASSVVCERHSGESAFVPIGTTPEDISLHHRHARPALTSQITRSPVMLPQSDVEEVEVMRSVRAARYILYMFATHRHARHTHVTFLCYVACAAPRYFSFSASSR